MTVTPLQTGAPLNVGAGAADTPLGRATPPEAARNFERALLDAFDGASAALSRADGAERAFAAGRGGLQEMVFERAQADIALSLASTAASHVTQALGTILGMQV